MSIWYRLASAVEHSSVGASIRTLFRGAAEVEREPRDRSADNEVPFTVGVIALSAKMAKADGVITRDEVKAFKEAFRVSDGDMKEVNGHRVQLHQSASCRSYGTQSVRRARRQPQCQ